MNQQAQVISTDSLLRFRAALIEYQEQMRSALSDCQSDTQRTMSWIEQEMIPYWTNQIKKRKEKVEQCKQAVNKKKLYDSPGGGKQSAVEEEKALRIAQRRLQTAEDKLAACKRWRRQVDRAAVQYQPMIQRLGQTVEQNVPQAVADLERAVYALERYRAVQAERTGELEEGARAESDMSRGGPAAAPWQPDATMLRALTPGPADRAGAELIEDGQSAGLPEVQELDESLPEAVAEHVSKRTQPERGQWVAVGAVEQDTQWYLHRMPAADEADTGWYLGPADGVDALEERSLRRCRLEQLLREQHRLEPLLGLPTGWVVAIEAGHILGAYDGQDELVWPR